MRRRPARSVVVVGAGGNIGSHLVPLVARLPGLERLTLIDPDRYEGTNLVGQAIVPADLGRAKVRVQAAHARRIRPDLEVEGIVGAVEQVPLGRLRADWIIACLDSRRARQTVNEGARRLGRPWIDTGVAAAEQLARVTVYGATAASACLECGWDAGDYAVLEQRTPCGAAASAAPTAAPAALGALAASLAALACGRSPREAAATREAREHVVAADASRSLRSQSPRRERCLVAEHAPWRIGRAPLDPRRATLADLVALGATGTQDAELLLAVAGRRFARRWHCERCGEMHAGLRATPTLRPRRCRGCGGSLVAQGFDLLDTVPAAELSRRERGQRLTNLGLVDGDVATFALGGRRFHLEIGSDRR